MMRIAAVIFHISGHYLCGYEVSLYETLLKDSLRQSAPTLHLSGPAIDQSRLESVHQTGHGPTISRFHQTFRERDVFGLYVNVLRRPNGEVVALSGALAPQNRPP